jgi:hypothetical protein
MKPNGAKLKRFSYFFSNGCMKTNKKEGKIKLEPTGETLDSTESLSSLMYRFAKFYTKKKKH